MADIGYSECIVKYSAETEAVEWIRERYGADRGENRYLLMKMCIEKMKGMMKI